MYTSSIIRAVVLFTSLASLPLFASAAPVNALEILPDGTLLERTIDERDAYAGRPNGTSQWVKERSYEEYDNGNLVRRTASEYKLDCTDYPEICANICYYEHCKGGNLIQHAKSGRTEAAACSKRPNKCSTGHKGPAGAYPHTNYQCDEYPLASTTEGGNANSATRCVPQRQNSSAGGKFKFAAGTVVTTVLLHTDKAPFYCDKVCKNPKDVDGRQA